MPIQIIMPAATIELKAKEITKALRGAGQLVAATAKALIQGSPGGPGNPPSSRTGTLASSIRTSARRGYVKVIANAGYATALEVGAIGGGGLKGTKPVKGVRGVGRTRRGVAQTARKMAARPFMGAALASKEAEIERRITEAVMKDIIWKATK